MVDAFKPGDIVPKSGIYRVVHDLEHRKEHEVTVVKGETFPACYHCGKHPRFTAVRLASYVKNHEHFKR